MPNHPVSPLAVSESGLSLRPSERSSCRSTRRLRSRLSTGQRRGCPSPGRVERHTHDFRRTGTTSLFAALEVAIGTVMNEAPERHTGEHFLTYLRLACPDLRGRRGSSESVRTLVAAIERFTREWNAGALPFKWVKTPDEILAKAVRKTQATSGAGR